MGFLRINFMAYLEMDSVILWGYGWFDLISNCLEADDSRQTGRKQASNISMAHG